jgi:hypothetical protein
VAVAGTTVGLGRQVRGELRKLVHPLVALAIAAIAVSTCALQASHINQPYPGPSIIDLSGCLRIAFLQHATTFGFLLAGVLAAVGTADEAGRGALADVLLHEPSRLRLAVLKSTTITLGMIASVAVSTVALLITRAILSGQGNAAPVVSKSPFPATLIDVGGAFPVLVLSAALALVIALLTRSVIATVALTVTAFYLPLTILQDAVMWATPTRWIIEWLHLDPFGAGVDYLANNSVYEHRGHAAVAGGLLIASGVAALSASTPTLLSRAVTRSNERNA